jgi:tetratricopeptide (TPR) repeat protein
MIGGNVEMDKELMMPTEISIKDKKQIVKGNVIRAAVFSRSKVIEAFTAENERFYLVYYKNSFVYGGKLEQIEESTFIYKAFSEGIVIEASNPILTVLIPHLSVAIPNKNKLFAQLQINFSLPEMAYIATTLDSFFEKEQLIAIIDKVFFHYRRAGNFMIAYQVIQILSDFAPTLKSAKDRLNSSEFNSYHDFYHSSSLPSILKKDSLYVELHCFNNRFNPDERILLKDILSKQDGLVELLLWLENIAMHQEVKSIEKYTEIALRFITKEEWVSVLGQININPFRELPDALSIIEKMLKKGNYEKVALCLLNFIDDLPTSYDAILGLIWENLDSNFVISHLDESITLLQHLPNGEKHMQSEQKIYQLAVILLEERDLKMVREKLLPIQTVLPQSEVIRKINEMVELLEDPDRMMELGDYYTEFKQFDKAIDCFSWEMELNPQDPSPVQKISKIYQNKGMVIEATAYQKIYSQLKSNQETG